MLCKKRHLRDDLLSNPDVRCHFKFKAAQGTLLPPLAGGCWVLSLLTEWKEKDKSICIPDRLSGRGDNDDDILKR